MGLLSRGLSGGGGCVGDHTCMYIVSLGYDLGGYDLGVMT